jgi:hypothetical protein
MSSDQPQRDDCLSPTQFVEINRVCDRFEAAWRAGNRALIEEHPGEVPESARADLLRELLPTELALRRSAGECPDVAEYRTRFPDHAALVEAAFACAGRPL